jgi:hypothetical protein
VDHQLLNRLSQKIWPASLRLGPKEPRRRTFVVGFGRSGRDRVIQLQPVARCFAVGRALLDLSEGDRRFWVAGPVSPTAGGGAEMILRSGPNVRSPRRTRLAPTKGIVFATFVSASGGGPLCYPALDVGRRGFRMDASAPFEPGAVLKDVAFRFGREVIRGGEGVVTSCAPVYSPVGGLVHECKVRLRAPRRGLARGADDGRIDIDDPASVRAVLWALSDLQHDVWIAGPGGAVEGRVLPARDVDRSRVPLVLCRVTDTERVPEPSQTVSVDCSLFGSGYRFFARIVERRAGVLSLSPTARLTAWHRRREERTRVAAGAGTVSFRHALGRGVTTRPLADVSARGFSFDSREIEEEIGPGLQLERARLELGGRRFRAGSAVIRSMSAGLARAEMSATPEADADALQELLLESGPAPITFDDGRSLERVVAFHRSMALLDPAMEANLAATYEQTREIWRRAHAGRARLMRTAIVPWRGGIGATLTAVRAYERTWLLQHSAALPGVSVGAGELHGVLMRLAAQRADGEYFAGFLNHGARTMRRTVDAFFAQSARMGSARFSLYAAPATPSSGVMPPSIRLLRRRDELLIEHAAECQIDAVCARALGLRAGEIELPSTRAAYRRIGAERRRRAYAAFDGDHCAAILLQEAASPGLALSGLLSAGMLLPVVRGADPDGAKRRALCELARATELPGAPPNRFLFLPTGADEGPVVAAGFTRVGACTLFALHRLGIPDYERYVAKRYGLLQARRRGRAARLSEVA